MEKTKIVDLPKITTPTDMEALNEQALNEALLKFEKEFKKENKGEKSYHLVIVGEYNRKTCNAIEEIYRGAGWTNVKCRTSSENNERGGLTGLMLDVN